MIYRILLIPAIIFLNINYLQSQPLIIDRVVAIVGKKTVLQSEIETHIMQMRAHNIPVLSNTRCQVLEELLEQKLLINQADIDSIIVPEADVDHELNSRLQHFIRQIGSEHALEQHYNKSILEIKEDLRGIIRDQLITRQMHMEITGNINVTPSEVRNFFNQIHPDSLPMINSQVELRQIVKYPELSETEKFEVKDRLNQLRQRIVGGVNFSTMAILYSQDLATARRGGELGFVSRTDVVPEFANVAFALKDERVSQVFESEFGYHIVQLIERRGDLVNVRHILMTPAASEEAKLKARQQLDSIAEAVRTGTITFRVAANRYTDDTETKMSGGLLINPNTRSPRFEMDQLPSDNYVAIRDLKVGEISDVFETKDDKGKTVFKILTVDSQTRPHRANLKDDYSVIQEMALEDKKMRAVQSWLKEKQKKTFVRIDETFRKCNFEFPGWLK